MNLIYLIARILGVIFGVFHLLALLWDLFWVHGPIEWRRGLLRWVRKWSCDLCIAASQRLEHYPEEEPDQKQILLKLADEIERSSSEFTYSGITCRIRDVARMTVADLTK